MIIVRADPPTRLRPPDGAPSRPTARAWLRPVGPPGLQLTEREATLVRWLALGCTDESAAKRMGISTRSVSNIMRSLMNRFDVRNRFQLGLVLGRFGLAPSSSDNGS